jgi:hypothetical protein
MSPALNPQTKLRNDAKYQSYCEKFCGKNVFLNERLRVDDKTMYLHMYAEFSKWNENI